MHVRPGGIAFFVAQNRAKINSPLGGFLYFFKQPQCLASWSKLGGGKLRRELELARELGWDWGRATGFRPQEKGRGVLLDCA